MCLYLDANWLLFILQSKKNNKKTRKREHQVPLIIFIALFFSLCSSTVISQFSFLQYLLDLEKEIQTKKDTKKKDKNQVPSFRHFRSTCKLVYEWMILLILRFILS